MEYWMKRNLNAQQKLFNKSSKEIDKQLTKYYKAAMNVVIDSFEKTHIKLIETVGEGREPTPADLYKLDSYWKMQNELKNVLQQLGNKEAKIFSKRFTDAFVEFYEAIALPSQKSFSTVDKIGAQALMENIWCADGRSWSERVWKNVNKLQQALNDNLLACVVIGKPTSALKKALQEDFGVSYRNADSIARTELAHIQTQASRKRYIDYGCKEVEVYADKDERRCDKCGKLHHKRFPIGGAMPVPVHPNCRCCILPVID